MLLYLTSKSFDLAGAVVIDVPSPNWGDDRRRATRIATLDGGAVVDDFGHADADRTFTLDWAVSEAEHAVIDRLVRLHDRVRIGNPTAVFECIIGGYSVRNGSATLSLQVVDRLSG